MIERPKRASGELDRDRLWIHVPHFGDDADFGASASEFARTIYTTLLPDIILLIGKAAGEIYSGWRERGIDHGHRPHPLPRVVLGATRPAHRLALRRDRPWLAALTSRPSQFAPSWGKRQNFVAARSCVPAHRRGLATERPPLRAGICRSGVTEKGCRAPGQRDQETLMTSLPVWKSSNGHKRQMAWSSLASHPARLPPIRGQTSSGVGAVNRAPVWPDSKWANRADQKEVSDDRE
jgi:hypothetical protein